jgi:hypothetical protein
VRYIRNAINGTNGVETLQTLLRTGECSYQGTWRLIHSSAGPMTGRSCHPRDMTSPRIDSAVLLSRLRSTDAW